MSRKALRQTTGLFVAVVLLGVLFTPVPTSAQNFSAYTQYFGKNKVQYRNFKWNIYHSPHFDVDEATARADVEVFTAQMALLGMMA